MISDRAILRLEAGGPLDGEIAPASLYQALESAWPDRRARATARAARATPLDASTEVAAVFARAANLDATLIDLASDPLLGPLDLRVLYLPGLDIVQHSLFGAVEPGAMAPSSAAERLKALEQVLRRSLTSRSRNSLPDRIGWSCSSPNRDASRSPRLARWRSPARRRPQAIPPQPTRRSPRPCSTRSACPLREDLAPSVVFDLFHSTFNARIRCVR